MRQFPTILNKLKMQVAHVFGLPLFFLCFVLVFHPSEIEAFLDTPAMDSGFNLVMVCCIILLSLLITRALRYVIRDSLKPTLERYLIWCVAEAVVAGMFVSLYLLLMHTEGMMYLAVLCRCVPFVLEILVIPYTILTLLAFVWDSQGASPEEGEESLIRFRDSTKRLKFAIAASAVLYIAAEENYVRIHYQDSGKIRNYVLRASMRSIEESVTRHGIVRCHRSYFVNPRHVALLRKDRDQGAIADLDVQGAQSIPVSKSYYEALTKLL